MLIFLMAVLFGVAQAQPDDIYHCQNPKNVDKKTQLKCDKNSFEWKLDDLDPNVPPAICGENYAEEGQPESMPAPGQVEDDLEPCLLWSMFFGSLNTKTPTANPTTLEPTSPPAPTNKPTTEDGEDGDNFNPTTPSLPPASDGGGSTPTAPVAPVRPPTPAPVGVPTAPPTGAPSPLPTLFDPTRLRIEAFTLTFSWPPSMELNIFNGPDRLELYDITLQHLETSLRAELNGVPIDKIELSMQTALASNRLTSTAQAGRSWTELVTGSVQFGIPAPIESSTLQTLVMDTFSGNALDVYEFRLQLANDEVLKEIAKVSMNVETKDTSPNDGAKAGGGATEGGDGGLTWSPLLIAIVVCVVLGVIMACCFAYFLLYGRRRSRRSRQAKAQEEYKGRDFPELQTDPTPPSDGDAQGLEYTTEDYRQHQYEAEPRYPSKLPAPDGITMDENQNLHQPYLLNPVHSDAGSSLRNDGDTFYDMENQSLGPSIAPSLYSYREETSMVPGGNDSGLHNYPKQEQAPPPSTSLDSVPNKSSSPPRSTTSASDKGSPSKKSIGSTTSAGGLLGGLVGKYMGNSKNKNQSALGGDDNSSTEDEYGFEKEANPSVEDASLLRVDTATSNQSVTGNNSTSPPYVDDRSLISDGRVGQILGDVHSIQGDGQESPQNFDDIWNDDDDSEDEGHTSAKSTITDPDGTEQDVGEVLNMSSGSKPFDEKLAERPFDEQRIEQRDIVIPDIPTRNMALVNSQQETEKWSNGSNSQRSNQMLPPLDDDEVSQLGEDDLLPDPVYPAAVSPSTKNEIAPAKIQNEDESVEDYDHHHKVRDDSTQGSSTGVLVMEEGSIAEDSYGFVPQKHYQKKSTPLSNSNSPSKKDNDDVKLALPMNLNQGRQSVDSAPSSGKEVVLASSGSGDDQSVEAVSLGSGASPSKKAGLSSNIKSLAAKPRQLVKGMSARKKKNSDWSNPTSPLKDPVPRPISPTPSVESTDSAKFRALMNEPDVFDTPSSTETTPKEAVEDTKRKTPAPLLQRMPSDSDDEDCYLEDDQPVIPYPAGVLPKTEYEEKKDDASITFSLDEIESDA